MASRKASGNGSVIGFVLVIIALAAVIGFVRDNLPIVIGIAALIVILCIVLAVKRKKERDAYLSKPVLYIGNASTKTFHTLLCPQSKSIGQQNKVAFRSAEEARQAGYHPCNNCCK